METFVPLFPPFLDQDSSGPAVNYWGSQLIAAGYAPEGTVLDLNYTRGGKIAEGAMAFQRKHGITVDGNCGPETRTKWKEVHGIDLNKVPAEGFPGVTHWRGPSGQSGTWGEAVEDEGSVGDIGGEG